MKRHPLFLAFTLLLAAGLFTACEENGNTDDPDNGTGTYWTKSAAFRMQLKGKVKTLVDDSTATYTFDEKGNLLTVRDEWENGYEEETYIYNATGKVLEHRNVSHSQFNSYGDTTKVFYGTMDKYFPLSGYHIEEGGLYYNLERLEMSNGTTRYVASGDSVLMINTYSYSYGEESQTQSDTIGLAYNGGKYPVRLNGRYMWGRYTYAADGRFLTAEWGHAGHVGYSSSVKRTFKGEGPYQQAIMEERFENGVKYSEMTLTYNEHSDPTGSIDGEYQVEYANYVYDAQGNWTERTFRYKNGPAWTTAVKQTRQITYWD